MDVNEGKFTKKKSGGGGGGGGGGGVRRRGVVRWGGRVGGMGSG